MHRSSKAILSFLCAAVLISLSACGLALDDEARFERARRAYDGGDLAAAEVDLKALLQSRPSHLDARLLLGETLLREGDMEGAATEFQRGVELLRQPEQPRPNAAEELLEATGKLAALQLSLGQHAAALESAQSVIAADADNVGGYVIAGQAAYYTGDNAAARSYASRLLERSPDNPFGRAILGFVAAREGAREEAEAHFVAALAQDPEQHTVRLTLTRLQIAMAKHAAAVATLAPLLVASPTELILLQLVDLMDLGTPEARAQVEAVAHGIEVANAASPVPGLLRGRSLLQARDYPSAAAQFQSSMDKDGGRYAVMNYYVAQRATGNQEAAQDALQQWVESNPDDQTTGFMLASAYLEQGQNDLARELYEKLVGTTELDSPLVLNNLAWLYGEIDDPRAVETARQAHQRAPDNGAITDTLGWLLVKAGQRDEGIQMLRLAVQQAPESADIRNHLAAALAEVDPQDSAQRQIDRVLGGAAQ
jgi:tetratricopeptide (TPR) repeat protein